MKLIKSILLHRNDPTSPTPTPLGSEQDLETEGFNAGWEASATTDAVSNEQRKEN